MKIIELEFESYGVEYEQYFRVIGGGTAFAKWDEVYIGVGNTEREAADDAIDCTASAGHEYDWDSLKMKKFNDSIEVPEALGLESWDNCEEAHWYVALYVKFEEGEIYG